MTITTLQRLEDGTIASVAPVNENFEALRVGVNTNESNLNTLTANFNNLSKEVSDINEIVMPDLTYEKTDAKFLIAENRSQLRLKAGTVIRLDVSSDDVRFLQVEEDQVYNVIEIMDTGIASLQAGKDYYIYLVAKDIVDSETNEVTKTVELKASLNSTYPTGYNSNNSRKIGGFHTNCLAITSSNAPQSEHGLIGFNAGDVLYDTVYCLSHRPQSEPEGMYYDDRVDLWCDCYNVSGNLGDPTSIFGGTRTCNITYQALSERLGMMKKRFPTPDEFMVLADGSNQRTAVYGATQPSPDTTGGHTDTAGKAMVNHKGGWEFAGLQWQFTLGISGDGGSNFATTDGSGAKGQTYGTARILFAGGSWFDSSSCGSRALLAGRVLSDSAAAFGGRAVSQPLRV